MIEYLLNVQRSNAAFTTSEASAAVVDIACVTKFAIGLA